MGSSAASCPLLLPAPGPPEAQQISHCTQCDHIPTLHGSQHTVMLFEGSAASSRFSHHVPLQSNPGLKRKQARPNQRYQKPRPLQHIPVLLQPPELQRVPPAPPPTAPAAPAAAEQRLGGTQWCWDAQHSHQDHPKGTRLGCCLHRGQQGGIPFLRSETEWWNSAALRHCLRWPKIQQVPSQPPSSSQGSSAWVTFQSQMARFSPSCNSEQKGTPPAHTTTLIPLLHVRNRGQLQNPTMSSSEQRSPQPISAAPYSILQAVLQ